MNKLYKLNNKTGFTLLELAIVILLIWLLVTLTPAPHFSHRSSYSPVLKNCFTNQRVLMGAIEMYNMDHVDMLDTAFPGREFEDTIKLLNNEKYLKGNLTSRDNICSYGFINITESGNTFCVTHGTYAPKNTSETNKEPYYPELNSNSKCTRIREYEELKSEMKKEARKNLRKEALRGNFKELFLETPALPAFLLALVFGIGIWNYFSDLKAQKRK